MVAETAEELQLLRDKRGSRRRPGWRSHVLTGRGAARLRSVPRRRPRSAPPTAHRRVTRTRRSRRRSSRFAPSQAGAVVRTHAEVTGLDVDPDGGTGRFTVTTAAGHDPGAPPRQRRGRLGERARGAARAAAADPRRGSPPQRHRAARARARADGAAHRAPADAEAVRNGTFIIGGGWPARPEPAAGALLDHLGEPRRQHRDRDARRPAARRRPDRSHLVGRDGLHRTTSSRSWASPPASPAITA